MAPVPPGAPYTQILLRWRWLIIGLSLIGAVGFEFLEPWLPPQHHWIEIALYGLLFPGGTWVVLTALTRQVERQARIEQRLSELRVFIRQLAEQQSSGQLMEFIARYPTQVLPVTSVTLFGYDHRAARFFPLSTHDTQPGPAVASNPQDPCHTCPVQMPVRQQLTACSHPAPAPGTTYCLPLAYSNLMLGRLRLSCPLGVRLDAEQAQALNAMASEMALALMMATVHSMEVTTASSTARRDERRQLSVTLHNSLAQQIGYLHLSLDRLADAAERLPLTVVQELAGLRDVAGDAYHQIRDLLAGLRTPQFHNLGHLLDSRLQVFGRATGLKTHLEVRGEPRLLLPELNQQVFGLVHESLNNIQKHAGASRVEILLDWRETELVVEVADDGRGFDSAAAIADGHYGLAMLQEQTADLRGTLAIISVPGQGARLLFRIPLAAEVGAPSGLTPQSGGTS